VTATVPTGEGPFGVAIGPDGRSAYVAVLGPGNVSAIDTTSHHISATVNIGPPQTDPFNVAATPNALYVTNQGADTVAVLDPKTLKITATINVGTSPYGNGPYGVAVGP
jgi:YVTN family beta-propeller protein